MREADAQHVARKPHPGYLAGTNLRGLVRVMLLTRLESCVYAFRQTLRRIERIHKLFGTVLDDGFVPVGDDARALLYESDQYDETDLMEALART